MIRILVVEDQQTLADALRIAINAQPDLNCVGAVGTVEDALRLAATHDLDVVLMDVHLPDLDGIEGTRRITAVHPGVRVLILTADNAPDLLAAAAAAGAAGVLAKDSAFPDILAAIRTPFDGKVLVEAATLALLDDLRPDHQPQPDHPPRPDRKANEEGLTARELDVLRLMGEGLDPRAIAARLVVSPHTARGHVKNIITKLGTHSQLEAVVVATRRGILPGPDTSW